MSFIKKTKIILRFKKKMFLESFSHFCTRTRAGVLLISQTGTHGHVRVQKNVCDVRAAETPRTLIVC